jgi:poly [ADP-ribose] polymerase 2/3/4
MSTAVAPKKVLESCTLIYVEIDENSNKVWKGSVLEDGSFVAQWGRVGHKLQSQTDDFGSIILARYQLARMKRQKLRKGYTEAQIVEADRPITVTLQPSDLEAIAATQIHHGGDDRAKDLIRYLVNANIHQIISQTKITYHVETGTWRTALGLITPDAIGQARKYLLQIAEGRTKNSPVFRRLVGQYLRLIPQDLGKKLDESIFRSSNELQRQQEILDALDAAIQLTPRTIEEKRVFECKIRRVPGSIEWGKEKFREISNLYESTINSNHQAATYKLRRVYEVDIPSMRRAFEEKVDEIGNVKLHWHGTKASNLLSILRQGLIVPPADAIQCTGRMFGNGIYGSEQSTKALNYATSYWNQSGDGNQRIFMLLCEFAMGREYYPKNWDRSFPKPGYDSTNVSPGMSGVINQESIVYNIDQVNIKYLCEFE